MATKAGKAQARKALAQLVERFPPSHKVKLIFQKWNDDSWAETYIKATPAGDQFMIRMQKEMDDSIIKATLVHEYAHCLAWYWDDHEDHGAAWGLAYAECWKFLFD